MQIMIAIDMALHICGKYVRESAVAGKKNARAHAQPRKILKTITFRATHSAAARDILSRENLHRVRRSEQTIGANRLMPTDCTPV